MNIFGLFKKNRSEKTTHLIEWQNKIIDEPSPVLIMTEAQLKNATKSQLDNDLRIINDSIKIISSTKDPSVFFSRLDLLEEKLNHAASIEQYASFSSAKPSDALHSFSQETNIAISDFLKRYYCALLDKIDSLKTEKGKKNQCIKFREALLPYYERLTKEQIEYIDPKFNIIG